MRVTADRPGRMPDFVRWSNGTPWPRPGDARREVARSARPIRRHRAALALCARVARACAACAENRPRRVVHANTTNRPETSPLTTSASAQEITRESCQGTAATSVAGAVWSIRRRGLSVQAVHAWRACGHPSKRRPASKIQRARQRSPAVASSVLHGPVWLSRAETRSSRPRAPVTVADGVAATRSTSKFCLTSRAAVEQPANALGQITRHILDSELTPHSFELMMPSAPNARTSCRFRPGQQAARNHHSSELRG
jgi:hypothetical protein